MSISVTQIFPVQLFPLRGGFGETMLIKRMEPILQIKRNKTLRQLQSKGSLAEHKSTASNMQSLFRSEVSYDFFGSQAMASVLYIHVYHLLNQYS